MRVAIGTFSLILFLAGCGGGGGTPIAGPVTTSSCVVKPAIGSDKYRSAILDMRFEQPNDFTADGKLVNSYEAVVL